MAEFERGDIVEYTNSELPRSKALGIVSRISNDEFPGYWLWIEIISVNAALMEIAAMPTPWHPRVWRKVGHINLPPEAPHD